MSRATSAPNSSNMTSKDSLSAGKPTALKEQTVEIEVGTRPKPTVVYNNSKMKTAVLNVFMMGFIFGILYVTYVSLLCDTVDTINRLKASSRNESSSIILEEQFKCQYSNGSMTLDTEKPPTESCEKPKNASSVPYCYSTYTHNMKSHDYKVAVTGCWSEGGHDSDKCVDLAKRSETESACILQDLSGGSKALYCCCLRSLCNANMKDMPSIIVRN